MTSASPNSRTEAQTTAAVPSHLQRLVLTGFMGAGKTTIGRLLAARLQWDFLDLDTHLEQRASATIPELFACLGEAGFRQLESSALTSALSQTKVILALGGGTPEEAANQRLLEQTPGTFTIFLDAPYSTLIHRCELQDRGNPNARPVLTNPAEAQLRFGRRHPLYRRLAQLTLDTAELTTAQTVDALLHHIGALHLDSLNQTPHSRA